MEALGLLAAACTARRTTPERLLHRLEARGRIARRVWLNAVLDDVAQGTCSVLEHGYLHRVERAHGLSGARRQVRSSLRGGTVFRDVEYDGGLIVELDGRLPRAGFSRSSVRIWCVKNSP